MSEASDLFDDSDDSLLIPDYFDDVVDSSISSSDFDYPLLVDKLTTNDVYFKHQHISPLLQQIMIILC